MSVHEYVETRVATARQRTSNRCRAWRRSLGNLSILNKVVLGSSERSAYDATKDVQGITLHALLAARPNGLDLTVLAGQRQWIATTNLPVAPAGPSDSFANSAVLADRRQGASSYMRWSLAVHQTRDSTCADADPKSGTV